MTSRAGARDQIVGAVFLAAVAFGGSNSVAIRLGLGELPPIWSATLRFGLAAVILVVVAIVVRPPLPRGRTLLGAALYGLLNFAAFYAFLYVGLVNGGAGVAQVCIAIAPLLTLLLAASLGLEPFSWQGLGGALVAGAGILVIFSDRLAANVPLASLLLFLAGAVCVALTNVVAKRIPPGHPVPANAVGMAIGALVLATLSLALGETWSLPTRTTTWVSVVYLATVGSVGLFLAYLYVLARWTATATSYVLLLMPLWTIVAAAVLLHESVSPVFLLGGTLVLAGTYAGAFLKPRRREAAICQPPDCVPTGGPDTRRTAASP